MGWLVPTMRWLHHMSEPMVVEGLKSPDPLKLPFGHWSARRHESLVDPILPRKMTYQMQIVASEKL